VANGLRRKAHGTGLEARVEGRGFRGERSAYSVQGKQLIVRRFKVANFKFSICSLQFVIDNSSMAGAHGS